MKFRIFFSISQTERKLRLRFWKWDVWRLDSETQLGVEDTAKNSSKAGFLSFKKKDEPEKEEISEPVEQSKLLFQALFHPEVESKILHIGQKLSIRVLELFRVRFEDVEIRGTLGDPFYDAIALGISGGCYFPEWEKEEGDWSAKGVMILKTGIFHLSFFIISITYNTLYLIFILWRGARLARKNPNGENLSFIRRWIFLKCSEAL
jgi:hypothetical protein